MSHSKHTKRGFSLYIEKWNSSAKKYITTCAICGKSGYSPSLEEPGLINSTEARELRKMLPKMALDRLGRCTECARVHDKINEKI